MKTILIILLCIVTFNCNAQYSKQYTFKDIAPQTFVLTTTFITVEYMMQKDMSSKQGTIVAFTGIGLTLITHYTLKTIKNNSPKKRITKRRKKLSYL